MPRQTHATLWHGWDESPGYSRGAYRSLSAGAVHQSLQPLIEQLRAYDGLRLKLERQGGRLSELTDLNQRLNAEFIVHTPEGDRRCHLARPEKLRTALWELDYALHLEIRLRPSGLPVYALCRLRQDYGSAYGFVLEDYYLSPGYPLPDERFIKVMRYGHEVYFLRLSLLREPLRAARWLRESTPEHVDALLCRLGRQVFQATWHEDQRVGVLAAGHLRLPRFREAIEVLYLILNAELCELRSAVDATVLRFFATVYPQHAIRRLLTVLANLDGDRLATLPRRAGSVHQQLGQAFSRFLATELTWGTRQLRMSLKPIVLGNLTRLERVSSPLLADENVKKAAKSLERTARALVTNLLNQS